jgi:hypothetical protein
LLKPVRPPPFTVVWLTANGPRLLSVSAFGAGPRAYGLAWATVTPDASAARTGTGVDVIPPSVSAPSATVAAIDATIDLDLFMRFPLVAASPHGCRTGRSHSGTLLNHHQVVVRLLTPYASHAT